MNRQCPACEGTMIDGPMSPGAWACTACGGVWAGRSVSNQFASVLDPAVRELADVAQRHAEMQRAPRPIPRTCPDCRAPLQVRELGVVTVDVCMPHGTWFDRGELQRVSDERQGRRPVVARTHEPDASGGAPTHAGSDLAADVAVGALGLLFGMLTD